MKEQWNKPSITIIHAETEDVIVTSNGKFDENIGEWD